MILKELLSKWENVSWESTIYIEFINQYMGFVGGEKILVNDITNPANPRTDLLNLEVINFRKSVNGIRIRCEKERC